MAERPVFAPSTDEGVLVEEIYLPIVWHSGFAPIQKARNIAALHTAAAARGYWPILEVSTKSAEKLGQHLSAFHLKVTTKGFGSVPLECAFQGSKIFARGGPFTDLYLTDARAAKRDPRLRAS